MKTRRITTLCSICAIVVLMSTAVSLNATIWTVTTLADSGAGSLRDRIASSSGGDTIQFSVTGVIGLNSSITIPHALTVEGPGPSALILDCGSKDRAFNITDYPAIISGMTIVNGLVMGANGTNGGVGQDGGDAPLAADFINAEGGAILATNPGSIFILSNCWFNNNMVMGGQGGRGGDATFKAGNGGKGGYAVGGALSTIASNLTIVNCTFSQNRVVGGQGGDGGNSMNPTLAGGYGGSAAEGDGGAFAGGYSNRFINCTFSGNSASGGTGGHGGNSTGAGGQGGAGGKGYGGALNDSTIDLLSCTIVQNDAFAGLGGMGGSGSPPGGSGLSGSGTAGGVYALTKICPNRIANTILANNYADTSSSNYYASFTDDGFNFIGSADFAGCPFAGSTVAGTIAVPIHPQLGPLAQNGGGLPTHATILTSPNLLIDQGYSFGLTTDERGAPRPYVFGIPPETGDGSDIGAFELGSSGMGMGMASNNVILSWPAYYGDFTVQFATSLQGTNNWNYLSATPVQIGGQLVVTNPVTNTLMFYRLISQ
jgi:hypothetical protein